MKRLCPLLALWLLAGLAVAQTAELSPATLGPWEVSIDAADLENGAGSGFLVTEASPGSTVTVEPSYGYLDFLCNWFQPRWSVAVTRTDSGGAWNEDLVLSVSLSDGQYQVVPSSVDGGDNAPAFQGRGCNTVELDYELQLTVDGEVVPAGAYDALVEFAFSWD